MYKEPRLPSPAAGTVTVGSSVELLSRSGLQQKTGHLQAAVVVTTVAISKLNCARCNGGYPKRHPSPRLKDRYDCIAVRNHHPCLHLALAPILTFRNIPLSTFHKGICPRPSQGNHTQSIMSCHPCVSAMSTCLANSLSSVFAFPQQALSASQ